MTSIMLEAAIEYAQDRGWPVFPCNQNKEPLVEGGVLSATTSLDQIKAWWTEFPNANIGLDVGGAGMMVLDLDPGYDPAKLEAAVGKLPKTLLAQKTPRGGEHLFYALDPGEIVPPSASKVAPNVDVRSFHSYVLLAPSSTEAGEYVWASDDWPAPKAARRTEQLLRSAASARDKSKDADVWIIEADTPDHVAQASAWLRGKAKVAVEGQGGDHVAYATAAMMKSFGISPEKALDLMLEHWNPRCIPPWSGDQVQHLETKIENAYSYNTSPPGNMTDEYHRAKAAAAFRPVGREAAEGNETTAGKFRIVDRGGIADIEPPTWLVADLLPVGGYGLIIGSRASFKTFIALDICLSVATGKGKHWGVPSAGPVLFAAGEGRSGLRSRVKAWEDYNKCQADDFYLIDPVPNMSRPEDVETFIKLALHVRPEGFSLVVIDTVGRAMQGTDENSQKDASSFTAMIERFQKSPDAELPGLGAAVLALHHTGHDMKRARGSSVFGADVDTELFVERDGKSFNATLDMRKQKDAAEWETRSFKVKPLDGTLVLDTLSPVVYPGVEKASQPSPEARQTGARRKGVGRPSNLSLELVDAAIVAALKEYKGARFSNTKFARMLASRMGAGVVEKTLRTNYLPAVRCDAKFKAHALYDAAKDEWLSKA